MKSLRCPICGSKAHVKKLADPTSGIGETTTTQNTRRWKIDYPYNIILDDNSPEMYLCANTHVSPKHKTWSSKHDFCWCVFSTNGKLYRYRDHIQLGLGDL